MPCISAAVSGTGGGAGGALLVPDEAQALTVSSPARPAASHNEREDSNLICIPLVGGLFKW
jgi:hypothetical protein